MLLTSPHIRLLLSIALFLVVAPLCASATECEPCQERACFTEAHGVVGDVAKRPVGVGASAPRVVRLVAMPCIRVAVTSSANALSAALAAPIPLRI